MRHYATACREHQVPVLLASMRKHCRDFALHVLAWDFDPPPALGLDVSFVTRAAFLRAHPELAPERLPGPPRSPVDTVVTMRWQFFVDVMEATGAPLTTIDGDMWFWSDPEPMFKEIGAAGMAVSPHRIPQASAGLPGVTFETHRRYGWFNAGLCYFADVAPVRDMALRNRAWSYTEVFAREDGGFDFGDQGHLERVAGHYGAHVIKHPGVNLAPWNVHGCKLVIRSGLLLVDLWPVVDCRPVVLYHYSSLRLAPDGTVAQYANPCYELTPWQEEVLYRPYVAALRGE